MKILVLGAGAVGSLYGGLLADTHEVTLVGRAPHMDAIRRGGLHINTGELSRVVHPRAADSIPPDEDWEIAAIAVKTFHLDEACRLIAALRSRPTYIICLQNGLGNEAIMAKRLPRRRIVRAIVYEGASIIEPGRLARFGPGITWIGTPLARSTDTDREALALLAESWSSAGFPTRLTDEIKHEIWRKLIINASINPLGAVTGLPNGGLVRSPYLRRILRGIVEECERVALAETGYSLQLGEMAEEIACSTSGNRNSMLLDLTAGRRTEIDFLNGRIVEIATRHEIPVPLNEQMVELVRRRESGADPASDLNL